MRPCQQAALRVLPVRLSARAVRAPHPKRHRKNRCERSPEQEYLVCQFSAQKVKGQG